MILEYQLNWKESLDDSEPRVKTQGQISDTFKITQRRNKQDDGLTPTLY